MGYAAPSFFFGTGIVTTGAGAPADVFPLGLDKEVPLALLGSGDSSATACAGAMAASKKGPTTSEASLGRRGDGIAQQAD